MTTPELRRIVTAQSLFSYLFNTVLVASALNIVVTAAGKGG